MDRIWKKKNVEINLIWVLKKVGIENEIFIIIDLISDVYDEYNDENWKDIGKNVLKDR